ncbi:MAG: hypothetical protein L3J75_08090 [Methylococcaceae bacterium]|nr:hypothetical protein [Methylococcaceae bacterium]
MNTVSAIPISKNNTAPSLTGLSNNPLDCPVNDFESALDKRQTNRMALIHWLKNHLVEGTDFGSIKTKRGLSKPSLWKAGAEKINTILSVSALFPSYADYEQAALTKTTLEQIIIRCELINSQQIVVASGIGARSLKQDYNDLNKSLKMASKSAYIDATLKLAGLSDIFTLDLEDMMPEQISPATTGQPNQSQSPVNKPPAKAPSVQTISPKQLTALEQIIKTDHIHSDKLLAWLSKVSVSQGYQPLQQFSELPVILVDQVMKKLPEFANTAKN